MLIIPSVSASSCILSVEAAEAWVYACDDESRVCNGVAAEHERDGRRVLIARHVDADAVVIERTVAHYHVAELAARRLMAADRLTRLYLDELIAEVDGRCGQVLKRLADDLDALIAFERAHDHAGKHVAALDDRHVKIKIFI